MIEALHTALSGMKRGMDGFQRAAARLANKAPSPETPRDAVAMKESRAQFRIQQAVVKSTDEMTGTLIDILA